MKSKIVLALAAGGCIALCGTAGAQDLGALKGAVGGADLSSLASGSAGNAAGVIEYCVKNNYLGGDAAGGLKDKLLGKVGGDDASEADKADYADGANGMLKTGDGKSVDLGNLGGGQLGGMKDKLTKKACSSVLDHAKSLL
ncbi:DUF2501 domain-containing protein [Dokdonella sp.]|uniref:DUF2501 domain-containing protein n=1 Tax=Dokdonella sp. TaxID=2291710 RepID=UPI001B15E86B|nr:DUF2501 domain-containing protein [Dokdonella sp.]MBO9664702.1 DUF2501 domain-containing protein [Dokdonella sp.]